VDAINALLLLCDSILSVSILAGDCPSVGLAGNWGGSVDQIAGKNGGDRIHKTVAGWQQTITTPA
jgi:hypothetical protein